jgi:hypothetical protein
MAAPHLWFGMPGYFLPLAVTSPLAAQTAHSGATVPVGSGFSDPIGVAVDRSGNVFVADNKNNAVNEIVAGAQKFPATQVGSTSALLTIYFTFDTGGSLAATPYLVLTQGAQNLDFKAAATRASDACVTGHAYNAGDICTVNVTLTPAKPYARGRNVACPSR